jgi:hypothetical protein
MHVRVRSGENNSRWFDGAQLTVTYEIDRDMFTFESYCICTRERQKRSGEQMKFYYPTSDPSDATYTTRKDDDEAVVIFSLFLVYLSCLGCSYFYSKCSISIISLKKRYLYRLFLDFYA